MFTKGKRAFIRGVVEAILSERPVAVPADFFADPSLRQSLSDFRFELLRASLDLRLQVMAHNDAREMARQQMDNAAD